MGFIQVVKVTSIDEAVVRRLGSSGELGMDGLIVNWLEFVEPIATTEPHQGHSLPSINSEQFKIGRVVFRE